MLPLNICNIKKIITNGVKVSGESVADVRDNMQAAIDDEMNSIDPEVQANFKKLFGNKCPAPKEYFSALKARTDFMFCAGFFIQLFSVLFKSNKRYFYYEIFRLYSLAFAERAGCLFWGLALIIR